MMKVKTFCTLKEIDILRFNNKNDTPTRGKKHWGCSGSVNILPRPSISNGGYERSPFTPTISYRHPLCSIIIKII
jgi:hypothetical protein